MKKNILYSIIALLAFASCRKQDNPKLPAGLARVPQIIVTTDPTGSQAIDLLNLSSFSGKFTVDMYNSDVPPAKVDIVAIKNGDKTNIKTFKAAVTTLPATFTVTNTDLVSLFGVAPKLGDSYVFGADITTKDGAFWQAFPPGGNAYGAFTNSFPSKTPGTLNPTTGAITGGSSGIATTATFAAICAYDPSIYTGPFKAKDAFGDADGAIIVLTKVDNSHFSFIYPSVLNPKPIIVTVNTGNNSVSVPLTVIGTAWDPAYGYPSTATYANPSLNSATGTVLPCDKTVTLSIQWGTNAGALQFGGGPYTLLLTKQ